MLHAKSVGIQLKPREDQPAPTTNQDLGSAIEAASKAVTSSSADYLTARSKTRPPNLLRQHLEQPHKTERQLFNRHKLLATKTSDEPNTSSGNCIAMIDVNPNQVSPLPDGISTAREIGKKRVSSPSIEDIKVIASKVNSPLRPVMSSQEHLRELNNAFLNRTQFYETFLRQDMGQLDLELFPLEEVYAAELNP